MKYQPRTGNRESSPSDPVRYSRMTERISQVIDRPPFRTIRLLRRHPSRRAKRINQIGKRQESFRQIADLCRPIIHLDIDIRMEIRIPSRIHIIIPYSLQICRKDTRRTRRIHQQVTSVLEIKRNEGKIRSALSNSLQPLVGRQRRDFTQIKRHPIEERSMFRNMLLFQRFIIHRTLLGENLFTLIQRIDSGIEIQLREIVVGRCREIEDRFVRIFHIKSIGKCLHTTSFVRSAKQTGKLHVQPRFSGVFGRKVKNLTADA